MNHYKISLFWYLACPLSSDILNIIIDLVKDSSGLVTDVWVELTLEW